MLPTSTKVHPHLFRGIFFVFEAIVVGMTLKDCFVRFTSMHGERFASSYYYIYVAAALCLTISIVPIRRTYPHLAWLGFATLLVAGFLAGCSPATY